MHDRVRLSNWDIFRETLEIREDWCDEFPLHGIVNEVFLSGTYDPIRTCIILRAQSAIAKEQKCDLEQMQKLGDEFECFNLEFDCYGRFVSKADILKTAAAKLVAGFESASSTQGIED
ncbi:hypothetical protein HBH98_242760 [Parastagonospora nodorum]|nr:hypothetical protein HBH53_248100 [Parastagonospora nodorum]KAH3956383.1 hypothetical protein HBH51_242330 [Parastagonospora nodorum]KAH4215573.1 hypothetical protein HBI06_246900 [Parastagonospora nodorum]KAH4223708.1 hypothetical protein HBI05_242820 [Parastagonospora nodorum]KAH4334322.1 hypothetical protein HBH98_242760 [Parastagonospora nodorum]